MVGRYLLTYILSKPLQLILKYKYLIQQVNVIAIASHWFLLVVEIVELVENNINT